MSEQKIIPPFQITARDGKTAARSGLLYTKHGIIETPVFMPVATQASVKALTEEDLLHVKTQCILSNTYHLYLKPGVDLLAKMGGLHKFMRWSDPILTDSGGFQVMSLAKLRTIDADGVTFQSHLDGSSHRLTPERSIDIQRLLDATITMALDECTPFPATVATARSSLDLSMRWAALSKQAFRPRPGYGLFGIVQGSIFAELRAASAETLRAIGFDGYALGGLAVGEGQVAMFSVLDATVPRLPAEKPRYLMGVGTPDDLLGAVARGVDMFDCVIPTRGGRTARAFTSWGIANLRNARFADDPRPLDAACSCPACMRHSRAYLHHLFRAGEMLGPMLLTWHNLSYYQDLMRAMRQAIVDHRLSAHICSVRSAWRAV